MGSFLDDISDVARDFRKITRSGAGATRDIRKGADNTLRAFDGPDQARRESDEARDDARAARFGAGRIAGENKQIEGIMEQNRLLRQQLEQERALGPRSEAGRDAKRGTDLASNEGGGNGTPAGQTAEKTAATRTNSTVAAVANTAVPVYDVSKIPTIKAEVKEGSGMRGPASDDVKQVQNFIKDMGLGEMLGASGVDGRYGPKTDAAMNKLQMGVNLAHNLGAKGLEGVDVSDGITPDEMKKVQAYWKEIRAGLEQTADKTLEPANTGALGKASATAHTVANGAETDSFGKFLRDVERVEIGELRVSQSANFIPTTDGFPPEVAEEAIAAAKGAKQAGTSDSKGNTFLGMQVIADHTHPGDARGIG